MSSGCRIFYTLVIFVCLKELQDMLSCQFLQETGYFLHVEKIRENKCYNVK